MLEQINYYTYQLTLPTQQNLFWKADQLRQAQMATQNKSEFKSACLGIIGAVAMLLSTRPSK